MSVAFPSLTPTSRSFQAPRFPSTSSTSQGGVVTRRLWGSQPSQGQLSLTFANISDDHAALLLEAYAAAKGPTTELTLPSTVFNGVSDLLQLGIDSTTTSSGLKWFFAEDGPSVESIAPGISTVTLELTVELRTS